MRAITVVPGKVDSVQAAEVPEPRADGANGRQVQVKVLEVGLDATDREINEGAYGAAPPGADYLILGHESLGVVERVGDDVSELSPGDYVVPLVRHPGSSLYDVIGRQDMTTDETYDEHGISRMHGFLTERYVDRSEYLVKVPQRLRNVAVLLEPLSIAEKGIEQAYEIQRRLKIWRPRRAAVLGAGSLGLLTTMALRLRGLHVTTFARQARPYLKSDLVEALGARYLSTRETPLLQAVAEGGPFDLVFEVTGHSPVVFEAMQALAKNGILALGSITSGQRTIEIPSDALNQDFVLGNKVMVGTVNASKADFEAGVRDLAMAEAQFPGWLGRLITRRVKGLVDCPRAVRLLETGPESIKTVVEVAALP